MMMMNRLQPRDDGGGLFPSSSSSGGFFHANNNSSLLFRDSSASTGSTSSTSSSNSSNSVDPLAQQHPEVEEPSMMMILEDVPAPAPFSSQTETPLLLASDQEEGTQQEQQRRESYKPRTTSRAGNSCRFVCVGLALCGAALGILLWNEAQDIALQKFYQHAAATVQELDGRDDHFKYGLVHITGMATSGNSAVPKLLQDAVLGVKTPARSLKLVRTAEMYQWVESDELNDETGDYDYEPEWSVNFQNSSTFVEDAHPTNPDHMAFESETWTAEQVTIVPVAAGEKPYNLSPELVQAMEFYKVVENLSVQDIPDQAVRQRASVQDSGAGKGDKSVLYIQGVDNDPAVTGFQIGDSRIAYKFVEEQTVSIIALLNDTAHTLESYSYQDVRTKRRLLLIEAGTVSAKDMLQRAQALEHQGQHLNVMRFICGLLFYLGLLVLAKPVSVLEDLVPALQDVIGPDFKLRIAIVRLIPFALAITLTAMALCWLTTHPILSLLYLVLQTLAFIDIGHRLGWWRDIVHRNNAAAAERRRSKATLGSNSEDPQDESDATYQLILQDDGVEEHGTSMELNEV